MSFHFQSSYNVQVQMAPNRTVASNTFIWTEVEIFSYCDIIGDFCIIQTLSFVKCVEWKIQYWSFQTKYFFQWPRKCPSSCLGTICLQICLIKYKLPNADWNVKRESSPKYFFINLTSTMVDKHCICIGRVITIQNWWLPHI